MKNKYQTAKIIRIEKETDKVKNFILGTSLSAKPGQYVMVWLPRINEKPFGIADSSPLMLSIAKVGPFSSKIHKLQKGDKISFRGAYGSYFKPKGNKILLVGGGYGVVPLYFLAKTFPVKKRKTITAVVGAKTKKELPFVSKFKKLGCNVEVATDDGSKGFNGFSTDLAEKLIEEEKFDSCYTCGPEIMMKKVAFLCRKKKIYCQVSIERFFKCGGMGLCGECSLNGYLVCKEGPVFLGKILLK